MLGLVYSSLRWFDSYLRCQIIISLAVLVTFSSAIISPAFANNYDEDIVFVDFADMMQVEGDKKEAEIPSDDSCSNAVGKTDILLDNYHYNLMDSSFLEQCPLDEFNATIKEAIDSSSAKISDNQSPFVVYFLVPGAVPEIGKESAKKAIGKVIKSQVLTGEHKKAYGPIDSLKYVKRSFIDPTRDFRRVAKKMTKEGNYTEAGKIIQTSIISHVPAALVGDAIGYGLIGYLIFMGLPVEVGGMARKYYWTQIFFGTFLGELGTGTAETIISLERPELVWVPSIVKVAATGTFFALSDQLTEGVSPVIRWGVSEMLGSLVNVGFMYSLVQNEPKFEKYQMFNFGDYKWEDFKNGVSKVYDERGFQGFKNSLLPTVEELSNMLMDGFIYGGDAYAARGKLAPYFLFLSAISAGNAKQSHNLLSDTLAHNSEGIDKIRQEGIYASLLNSVPYVILFFAVPYITGSDNVGVARELILDQIVISNFGRMATEQEKSFNKGEGNRYHSAASYMKAGISVVGSILMKTNMIKANRLNRSVIRGVRYFLIFAPIYAAYNA